tara:strand:- start:252 stop:1106 length:855 start_codon:yes stop_codon:yes gene_type:complete
MLDRYYLKESPLPNDPKKIARKMGMPEASEDVQLILDDFFYLDGDVWRNESADESIAEYHAKAETARDNGKKGGRPRKETQDKPSGLPTETQLVLLANPDETGSQANHKPITNNQEPVNKYVHFDDFWKIYPHKKGKAKAEIKWPSLKVTDSLFSQIKNHIESEYKYTEKQFIPHGDTYVNSRRWLDYDEGEQIPYEAIKNLYNEKCPNLISAGGINESITTAIDEFWNYRADFQDLKIISSYFTLCNADESCRGSNGYPAKSIIGILKPQHADKINHEQKSRG